MLLKVLFTLWFFQLLQTNSSSFVPFCIEINCFPTPNYNKIVSGFSFFSFFACALVSLFVKMCSLLMKCTGRQTVFVFQ